jgi:uridine kinase
MDLELINYGLRSGAEAFIREWDRAYYSQIEKLAENIIKGSSGRPVILICGPSGSGKTTTALALENLLDGSGHETHTISMDNYFKTMTPEERELYQRGELDLEAPARLDIELLNSQLADIAARKPVYIPKYDFKTSESVAGARLLERKPGELVVLEGIHALNPEVITIPEHLFASVYVSVRTRVSMDNFVLHPERIRLMRRMIRDSVYRGRSFTETLDMYERVQNGESKYIMPYKRRAHYEVDSFIAYELGAYKKRILGFLKEEAGLEDLRELMEAVEPVDEATIPPDSLIREFIGGSSYKY